MHEQCEGEKQVKGTGDIFKSNKIGASVQQ